MMRLRYILQTKIIFFQNIGPDYLHRWRLFPIISYRGDYQWHPPFNVFLHRFLQSDKGRDLHDHPWPSWSVLLRGDLYEVYGRGAIMRKIPRLKLIYRPAEWRHRLVLHGLRKCKPITLFVTGKKVRDWGFWPDGRWVYWKDYLGVK